MVVTLLGSHPVPWVMLISWSLYISLWRAGVSGMCHQASLRWHYLINDTTALCVSVFLQLIEAPDHESVSETLYLCRAYDLEQELWRVGNSLALIAPCLISLVIWLQPV